MKFKTVLASFVLAFSAAVTANVTMEMFQMNRELGGLVRAESADAFQQAADGFLNAAKKAQETMPASLDGDQEKFKGYQQGIQEVIDVVEQSKQLAAEGKLEEAKVNAQKLNQLKKIYHKEYK